MRSGAQITRTVSEWKDYQRQERRRTLRDLLAELERARRERPEWYAWVADGRPELTTEEYSAYRTRRGVGRRSAQGPR